MRSATESPGGSPASRSRGVVELLEVVGRGDGASVAAAGGFASFAFAFASARRAGGGAESSSGTLGTNVAPRRRASAATGTGEGGARGGGGGVRGPRSRRRARARARGGTARLGPAPRRRNFGRVRLARSSRLGEEVVLDVLHEHGASGPGAGDAGRAAPAPDAPVIPPRAERREGECQEAEGRATTRSPPNVRNHATRRVLLLVKIISDDARAVVVVERRANGTRGRITSSYLPSKECQSKETL